MSKSAGAAPPNDDYEQNDYASSPPPVRASALAMCVFACSRGPTSADVPASRKDVPTIKGAHARRPHTLRSSTC